MIGLSGPLGWLAEQNCRRYAGCMAISRSDPRLEPLDDRLADQIAKVIGKRPLIVFEHILEHGHITAEELKDNYGYNHPPRAARDVRENGVPLDTFQE